MRLFGTPLPVALEPAGAAIADYLKFAGVLSALVNLLYLTPTLYLLQVYDRAVPTGGVITLLWITVVAGFALATLALLDWLRVRIMTKAGLRLENRLAAAVLERTLALRETRSDGGVALQPMREFDVLRQALSGPPALALFDLPWTPIYIIVAFLLHPLLGALVLVAAGVLLALTMAHERAIRAGVQAALNANATSYVAQERMVVHRELIRALGMQRSLVARQIAQRRLALALGADKQLSGGHYVALTRFLRLFLQSLALGVGAWLAIENQISHGSIIAASVLLNRALAPIEQLVATWQSIIAARQSIDVLGTLFADPDGASRDRFSLPPPSGSITVRQVTVRRPAGGQPLLNNVSFEIAAGEFVGIIGPSGAGKSTLARLLAGAIVADAGSVRIDGADRRDWDQERLARHIGYLPQDAALLPGTIAENIARFETGDPEQRAARVIHAAEAAHVHDMILQLPGGYDLELDWNNQGVSAGQRQRIALARALYGDPSILVLDEPNSALDGRGETALLAAIDAARARGATVIMVAHRASLFQAATRLIVLNAGRIELDDSREAVMSALNARQARPEAVPAMAE